MDRARAAAAFAALVLAVTSRGDALGLAALLAVVAWRPLSAIAVAAALATTAWRWGSSSLEAIAGAQAVLGPAGLVRPDRAATASWLAAGAIVLASPPGRATVRGMGARSPRAGALDLVGRFRSAVPALATGTAAALVVAGPAPGGDVWVRVLAGLIGTALAAAAAWCRARVDRVQIVLDAIAVAAALGALALVSSTAPTWSSTVDAAALGYGAVTAIAVGLIAVVAGGTAVAMGRRQV